MSTARRDILTSIESTIQKQWEAGKNHEFDAPAAGEHRPPKFLVTFPYPYMNGRLHLGHGFSLTKAEFASRFYRMKGCRSLWPFGFHVTGTPIAACAQKISKEIEKYGNPPQFPEEVLSGAHQEMEKKKTEASAAIGQHKSKRGKAGPAKPQWVIMQSMGIPEKEIPLFSDPTHWLEYFPPLAMQDLKGLGCHIDFRRSFITTDRNPYYDQFVSWQFRKLRDANYLNYGKRYCVYAPIDGQPCADHDRASGEGVLPQEYTVVKLTVIDPFSHVAFAPHQSIVGDRPIILPGATLRVETVVGQTNTWVSPQITYGAFAIQNKSGKEEIFIMTTRAARNLAYQNFVVNGKTGEDPTPLFEVEGAKLIGVPLSAPLAPYKTIYTLPMATITETKGTGVVMSVPSDSPDDYINFTQLLQKPDYRAKLQLKEEWVMPFAVVDIIDVPGELGQSAAKVMCEKLKITGPNATDLLEEAKKAVYQAGFYQGVMITGPFKGEKVSVAKVKTRDLLEGNDECIAYYEPARPVTSRSGDDCVVALCDQWYIEYGKEEWKQLVLDHMKDVNFFYPGVRNGFDETLKWLSEWPCSRTFGLGTKLPCDRTGTMLVDSLSDSTIYMAYYTIAHFFQVSADGKLDLSGRSPNAHGIKPEMCTDETFDYIFSGTGTPESVHASTGIPIEALKAMRNEFLYWYPVDLRCSAKDLIQNHLTMFLYNHAAIWPNDSTKWPRSIFCNGHIQVDNEKMAKSKGNFISLREAIETYGADATRLACADAGDGLDDANFVRETAAGFILKLTTFLDSATELTSGSVTLRKGEYTLFDKIFSNILNSVAELTEEYYRNMQFRYVLNTAFHELTNEFSQYRINCDEESVHADLVSRYLEVFTLALAPLAPHFCEHLWQNILHRHGSVADQSFPTPSAPQEYPLLVANRVMTDVVKEIRSQVSKLLKKKTVVEEVIIYTSSAYAEWQRNALGLLKELYISNNRAIPTDYTKRIMANKAPWMTKDLIPETMAFLAFVKNNVDKYGEIAMNTEPAINDAEILKSVQKNLTKLSGVPSIVILSATDETYPEHKAARRKCRPGEPSIAFKPVAK